LAHPNFLVLIDLQRKSTNDRSQHRAIRIDCVEIGLESRRIVSYSSARRRAAFDATRIKFFDLRL
jgi:hypothetical protein